MEELFKKYCSLLKKDKEAYKKNPFESIDKSFKEGKIDFYDFIQQKHTFNQALTAFSLNLHNTGISKIEILENEVIFHTRLMNLKVVTNSIDRRSAPYELLNFGFYEPNETELLLNLISDCSFLLDIGANIGWFSLLMATKCVDSKILAFEPMPDTTKILHRNLELNSVKNVAVNELVIGNFDGKMQFYYSPEYSVLSSTKNIMDYDGAQVRNVNSHKLDSFLKKEEKKHVDLLRCDVEGGEFDVILGSKETLELSKPIVVLELFHEWSKKFNYHPSEVLNFMTDIGYEIFLPIPGGMEKVYEYAENDFDRQNYFFLHPQKHQDKISSLMHVKN